MLFRGLPRMKKWGCSLAMGQDTLSEVDKENDLGVAGSLVGRDGDWAVSYT